MEHAQNPRSAQPPLPETPAFVLIVVLCALIAVYWLTLTKIYFFTNMQAAEIAVYISGAIAIPATAVYLYATRRSHRENRKVHPPLVMSPARDNQLVEEAWQEDAVVLGYDIHGTPWLWPDSVRVMQGIMLGMTGSGKTTLLKNIITQDLMRRTGPPEDRHKIPMIIFDGKGDLEFFQQLLPFAILVFGADVTSSLNPFPTFSCGTDCIYTYVALTLQNIQLVVGRRYESEAERKRANRPLFSGTFIAPADWTIYDSSIRRSRKCRASTTRCIAKTTITWRR
jgi:hypothetical protein